jgi:formiminotetrahydrofolate cyclodeaminase
MRHADTRSERLLTDMSLSDFLDRLASGAPAPGGGAAAALAGSSAAALASMVCNLTLGKQELADVGPEIQQLLEETEALRAGLEFGVDADAEAFGRLAAAYRMPRDNDAQRNARVSAIRRASIDAARAPLEVGRLCTRVLDICTRLAEIGNPRVLTDVVVAAFLARAALHSAAANVEVNLPSIKGDAFWDEARRELEHLLDGREAQVKTILARVSHRT